MSWKKSLFVLVIALSIFLRFYRLEQVPAGLYIDELDLGYQARSLIETGRDYLGQRSPFYVMSFTERTPLPVYLAILSTKLFSLPEWQVRGGAAIAGVGTVILIYLLVWLWTKDFLAALCTSLVFITSPWQIQFSRIAFEGTTMTMFYLLGIVVFFWWRKTRQNRYLVLSSVFLSLAVYTYRTMSLFVPLTFLVLFGLYIKEFQITPRKILFSSFCIAALLIGAYLYNTTFAALDQTRINQISVFSDQETPIRVMRLRELASGDYLKQTLGNAPVWWSKIYFNKVVFWLDKITQNYLSAFSTQFLFLKGDPNLRHSIGQMGELFLIDIVGLLAGLVFVGRNLRKKQYQWLICWLLLSPLPSAITMDGGNHAHRLFIFSLPLLIVVGLGWWQTILQLIKAQRIFILLFLGGCWLWCFSTYLIGYFVVYPYTSARWFSYGYKQGSEAILRHWQDYQGVAISPDPDPPIFHFLYWAKLSPQLVQQYGADFSKFDRNKEVLGKLVVLDWLSKQGEEDIVEKFEPGILYLVSPGEVRVDWRDQSKVPPGLVVLEKVLYPDNEPAYYLVARLKEQE